MREVITPAVPTRTNYGLAILEAHQYLLKHYPEVFIMGQGVWSPWYVGNTMKDLDLEFGKERIIDTPVSEQACTGAAIGAALCGYKAVVVHPRVDFVLYAMDQIVNQAAKWTHMFGGKTKCPVTFRCIINRGGEQGAQHSQALHSWFAHIPGLRVVMPYSVSDARDLFIASVLCNDPVVFIDDRWLYSEEAELLPIVEKNLRSEGPRVLEEGRDITLVGCGFTTHLCLKAAGQLQNQGVSCEVIDLRILNPLDYEPLVNSVKKTGRLCVVDGDWASCGLAGEIIAGVSEQIAPTFWRSAPKRITLPSAPAPTSRSLEDIYYPKEKDILKAIFHCLRSDFEPAPLRYKGRFL